MQWSEQFIEPVYRAWAYVTTGRTLAIIGGSLFAILAISLLVASRTRWGQTKPLTKCIVVSVVLHVWLLMYAIGDRKILPQGDLRGREQNISVVLDESLLSSQTLIPEQFESSSNENSAVERAANPQADSAPSLPPFLDSNSEVRDADAELASVDDRPWEQPVPLSKLPTPPALEKFDLSKNLAPPFLQPVTPTPLPELPSPEELARLTGQDVATAQPEFDNAADLANDIASDVGQLTSDSPQVQPPVLPPVEPFAAPGKGDSVPPSALRSVAQLPQAGNQALRSVSSQASPIARPEQRIAPPANATQARVPPEYRLRQATNRLEIAAAFGADADSEAAVQAGLNWLASAQSLEGSWNAKEHGAGTETRALGENRYGTGAQADTGVSGLALLAFLSAGHTHLAGEHQQTVRRGLGYLLDAQMPSGDLSGPKQVGSAIGALNAKMYCHSIATLALAEAYAMTFDAEIGTGLLKATEYSLKAQDPRGGGWRYRPGDPGDLSQFGWQAMAIKSAQRSGITVPMEVERRMRRFLDSCAAGRSGGLATYMPKQGRPSDTMTAEALACRLMLDFPLSADAQREATGLIMKNRPGQSEDNVYFWYYATLALFQLQDENWRAWNQSMKSRLLATQTPAYKVEAGSWEPDQLWGGYGGRVYSTAMSCLCLEVYYRYLPMYQHSNMARANVPDNFSR